MKILFTTGTTRFDSLVKTANYVANKLPALSITVQSFDLTCLKGAMQAKNLIAIDQYADFSWVKSNFDLVVSHAGAGTIFKCLENNVPLIVFPNLERADKHQLDICRFLVRENLALAAQTPKEVLECITNTNANKFRKYINGTPFNVNKMIGWINE